MGGTRIFNVTRKPRECPFCKAKNEETTVDPIIYGTGDYTEPEFLLHYGKPGIMGGDNIPRQAPKWACSLCGRRFRLVDEDGNYIPWKVRLLKNEKVAKNSKVKIAW